MIIYIASDHAGHALKLKLIDCFKSKYEFIDLGTHSEQSTSYSEYGHKLAAKVSETKSVGVAICGSGIGISITVNRHAGIRGALCRSIEDATLSRQHNDANILCLGSRVNSLDQAQSMLETFLTTPFEGGRHQRRVNTIELP